MVICAFIRWTARIRPPAGPLLMDLFTRSGRKRDARRRADFVETMLIVEMTSVVNNDLKSQYSCDSGEIDFGGVCRY